MHYMIKIIANVVGAGLVSARHFEDITKIYIIYKKEPPFRRKRERKSLLFRTNYSSIFKNRISSGTGDCFLNAMFSDWISRTEYQLVSNCANLKTTSD